MTVSAKGLHTVKIELHDVSNPRCLHCLIGALTSEFLEKEIAGGNTQQLSGFEIITLMVQATAETVESAAGTPHFEGMLQAFNHGAALATVALATTGNLDDVRKHGELQ